jgi:hypothetical protein
MDRARGAEPDKEIGHAAQNSKPGEAITPEGMYLNLFPGVGTCINRGYG